MAHGSEQHITNYEGNGRRGPAGQSAYTFRLSDPILLFVHELHHFDVLGVCVCPVLDWIIMYVQRLQDCRFII